MEPRRAKTLRVSLSQASLDNCTLLMRCLIRKTFADEGHSETVRQGFEPTQGPILEVSEFAIGDDNEDKEDDAASPHEESDEARQWKQHGEPQDSTRERSPTYGSLDEERRVWGAGDAKKADTD